MFKVGDKLICIKKDSFNKKLEENKIYTISSITVYGYFINVHETENPCSGWFIDRFRLATPAEVRRFKEFSKQLEEIISE